MLPRANFAHLHFELEGKQKSNSKRNTVQRSPWKPGIRAIPGMTKIGVVSYSDKLQLLRQIFPGNYAFAASEMSTAPPMPNFTPAVPSMTRKQ
ncbi:hypothetical protein WA026_000925 [Henosepilachna vigintioctopunctata]|uniref:Uncharacterized protein n=1 Tax=Henosepilachna vigintioctopunctata TaxID=420089 RepID=A0AAW1V6S3_9CUCU